MDTKEMTDKELFIARINIGFKILEKQRECRALSSQLDAIQAEIVSRGISDAPVNIDYEAKYKKCIEVIKRFDPGIIGMYGL